MIVSFADSVTEAIWNAEFSKKIKLPASLQEIARRKLRMVDAATDLDALKIPPNNRLEALKGDRKGQYSIRINQQFRICFVWKDGNALDVEIVDYH